MLYTNTRRILVLEVSCKNISIFTPHFHISEYYFFFFKFTVPFCDIFPFLLTSEHFCRSNTCQNPSSLNGTSSSTLTSIHRWRSPARIHRYSSVAFSKRARFIIHLQFLQQFREYFIWFRVEQFLQLVCHIPTSNRSFSPLFPHISHFPPPQRMHSAWIMQWSDLWAESVTDTQMPRYSPTELRAYAYLCIRQIHLNWLGLFTVKRQKTIS